MSRVFAAWCRAEVLLARARLALKADDDQLAVEAALRRELTDYIEGIVINLVTNALASGQYPLVTGDNIASTANVNALATLVADELGEAVLLEQRRLSGDATLAITDFSPKINQLILDKSFEASQRTLLRLQGDINASLAASYRNGLGIADAAKALNDIFDNMKKYELERIARTEINGAQNAAAEQTIKDMRFTYHQWIATHDARTRDSHMEQDRIITRVGTAFPNGCKFPGDPNGRAEEIINCRCRIRPYTLPAGKIPPPNQVWFRESDLISVG